MATRLPLTPIGRIADLRERGDRDRIGYKHGVGVSSGVFVYLYESRAALRQACKMSLESAEPLRALCPEIVPRGMVTVPTFEREEKTTKQ